MTLNTLMILNTLMTLSTPKQEHVQWPCYQNLPLHINTILKRDGLRTTKPHFMNEADSPSHPPKTHKQPVPGYASPTNAFHFYHSPKFQCD